ncbi:MAG TPA: 2-C-methyl-D-erythritol 4-phosphate cytidylyltransferase [Burkholderiales bacterium]
MFALIPAAGSGSRASSPAPKQYAMLAGRPMLWHAVRAVCVPPVQAVFAVLAPDDKTFESHDWSAFEGRLHPLYCGGESRRDSVHNGLVATMDEVDASDWVLVHDAARPCLSSADLTKLIAACEADEVGGILALPVADTVKRGIDTIEKTEDRSDLWLAQTPQMFRAGTLLHALRRARGPVTDEASAVEQLGLKPRLVRGSRENLKVTWPEDLPLAEAILGRRA